MRALQQWLLREPSGNLLLGLCHFFLALLVFDLLYPTAWFAEVAKSLPLPEYQRPRPLDPNLRSYMVLLLATPLLEEFFYRVVPLTGAVWLSRWGGWVGIWAITVESSLFFGFRHVPTWGWGTIPFYFLVGVVYSLLYLKCGGLQGKILKPFAICVGSHIFWNWFALVLQWIQLIYR